MQRREVLKTVAGAVAAAMATSAAAAAQDHQHHHHDHGAMGGKSYAALIDSSSDCQKTGEACLAHCLVLLGQGDKEMAACAQSVSELLATCNALMKLALQGSRFTPAMAKVAADVCAACLKECKAVAA